MRGKGMTSRASSCWVLEVGDEEWHFPTRAEARAFRRGNGPDRCLIVKLGEPCWTLECTECEDPFENEAGGYLHFASEARAEAAAVGEGWRLVQGRWECPWHHGLVALVSDYRTGSDRAGEVRDGD